MMANTIIIFMLFGAFLIPCLIAIGFWILEKRPIFHRPRYHKGKA